MIFDPPFVKTLVSPGEPLTAQAWNDVVNALAQAHTYIESTASSALKVQVTAAGAELGRVRVTAISADGIAVDAIAPVPPSTQHVFAGLQPGAYTLCVEAPGFQAATAQVTLPDANVQNIALQPSGGFMPAIFGLTLQEAIASLGNAQIALGRILDITGADVPTANPGAQYTGARVLVQLPLAGTPVPTGQSVQLVIAATLQSQPSVEMPSLTGLTLAEAQKALEGIGLVLGKVVTKTTVAS